MFTVRVSFRHLEIEDLRDRLGRHALAVVPPGMALAVFGSVLAWRADAGFDAVVLVQALVIALLVVLLAAALMVWARRRVTDG
jgi:hypothetical protein